MGQVNVVASFFVGHEKLPKVGVKIRCMNQLFSQNSKKKKVSHAHALSLSRWPAETPL